VHLSVFDTERGIMTTLK